MNRFLWLTSLFAFVVALGICVEQHANAQASFQGNYGIVTGGAVGGGPGQAAMFSTWDSGNGKASWPTNGVLQLSNEAATAGVRLDVTTSQFGNVLLLKGLSGGIGEFRADTIYAGTNSAGFGQSNFTGNSSYVFQWTSSSDGVLGTPDTSISRTGAAAIGINGKITSSATADLGWAVVSGANTACNTTCTSACVVGFDAGTSNTPVACTDATADKCLCAGAS